jgi:hypothetical protein
MNLFYKNHLKKKQLQTGKKFITKLIMGLFELIL